MAWLTDHFEQAERLLSKSVDGDYETPESRALLASQAQAHATLALTQAVRDAGNV